MTINERYRIGRRYNQSKKYHKWYLLILLTFLFSFTMARYMQASEVNMKADVAKWNIQINNQEIDSENKTINLQLADGIIHPGDGGTFDIVIDPLETEVSVEYEIVIDYQQIPGMTVECSAFEENGNTITGTIRLKDEQFEKQIYHIAWEWEGDSSIEEEADYSITADVNVKQLIG